MKLVVIGLGLIGGSVAKSLKAEGFVEKVVGVDNNPDNRKRALELGIADEVLELEEACALGDLIVIAIPVGSIINILPTVLDKVNPSTVVTELGSTKKLICETVQKHPQRQQFVPSHPMAGTEYSGPDAAHVGLFSGKTAVVCEKSKSSPEAILRIEGMYNALNMRLIYMENPQEHDRHAAFVSHLSHISSFVLANTVLDIEKNDKAIFDLAGGGFESTVRLAKSSPEMWGPIFQQNKGNLVTAMDAYINHFKEFAEGIKNNPERVDELMNEANQIRRVLAGMKNGRK